MLKWIKSLFCKEETYSGGSNEAWRAFVKYTMEESRSLSRGKDIEAELIREIDKLTDDLDNVRNLLCKVRRQRENNDCGGNMNGLS